MICSSSMWRCPTGASEPAMKVRSMTGYAQVKTHVSDQLTLAVSLKSVNHRFLDLHLRIPAEMDAIEMKVRRGVEERLPGGDSELTAAVGRARGGGGAGGRATGGGALHDCRPGAGEAGV